MAKIVISDNMEEEVVQLLGELGEVVYKPDNLEDSLKDADALIVRSATKVNKELLSNAKKLRVIGRAGVGLDNIDQEYCGEKGIEVVNTPGASSNAVAELTLGIIICSFRNVQKANCQMRNKIWDKKNLVGREIEGKTLGIIGYGRIGHLVGKKAHALGMKILAFTPPPRHEDDIVEFVDDLWEFLGMVDVVTLHAGLDATTKNIINKESISQMKDGAYIVNIARGEMVDEDALYDACKSGKLAGAALDVYPKEPYTGKLLELDNVYFTPHIGGSTKEAQLNIGKILVEKLKEKLK
jgi:D-3-phosphoglycerate dehydrogenase